ncbi:MAG: substrate-binding periplasmic protein [Parvibaculaceae bacterium]
MTKQSLRGAMLALAFIAASAGLTAPAAAENTFGLAEDGVLTVAVFANAPPVIGYDSEDKMLGVDGAFLESFAGRHGLKIKLYKTTFASTILAVKQGKADIGTWFYYTEERAKQIRYTLPYLRETASVFTMDSFDYKGLDSLAGKRVAAVVGHSFAPYVQKAFGDGAKLYPDGIAARTALLNGQVDAYVDSSFVIDEPPFTGNDKVKGVILKVGDLGLPQNIAGALDFNFVACGNTALAAALDAEMKSLHEGGQWQEILKKNGLTEESLAPTDPPKQMCE